MLMPTMTRLLKHKYFLGLLTFFAGLATLLTLGGGQAQAATLNVSGGCTITIAINSVNAGSTQTGCTSTGTYGTNDTITIAAGTQTLTTDLPSLTEPVVIKGAGMDQTTINGDGGQYATFKANSVAGPITITDMKITAFRSAAIDIEMTDTSVILKNIDVDGHGAKGGGIYINALGTQPTTFNSEAIYVHDIDWAGEDIYAFAISKHDTTTLTATISNTTIANITTSGDKQLYGFGLLSGAGGDGTGTLHANITNTTIDNLTADAFVAPFYVVAFGASGNTTITADVTYVTVTETHGGTGSLATETLNTAAFYAIAGGSGVGSIGTATINVNNSLFANNFSDNTSSNCGVLDATAAVGVPAQAFLL